VTGFAALPAVALAELQETAALQTRVDRKYVLPLDALPGLLAALPDGTRRLVIDGRDAFGYESVYFDTPDLDAFRLAAGRRRRRYKVRTRTYCDTGGCWLEVKTRARAAPPSRSAASTTPLRPPTSATVWASCSTRCAGAGCPPATWTCARR
jgi:hypothetical protein